ncbi:cupin domain-containing protein [Albibacterium indicum]|uniref:cupin domain-containing protein n=1 Tax=Albibacterium indicum TaxID=2292082 RepID=UPI000E4D4D05|nr:cupin domain-containing protein [Pedobacter indicus]
MIKDTTNSKHYYWGDACDGWHLVQTDSLSIIQEKMPPGSSENLHYHTSAQQFFYILKGTAVFEVENEIFEVKEGQGFHILLKQTHRIFNKSDKMLEFIVISEPKSHGDRIDL